MKGLYLKQQIWPALLAAFILLLDQSTKAFIVIHFSYGEHLTVTPFFNLVLTYNKGAAFSFLAGYPEFSYWFFSVVGILVCLLFLYWSLTSKSVVQCFMLWLIIGGALGNVIDRLRLGHVVDFLDFYVGKWHWPAFNLADTFVVIGLAFYLVWGFKNNNNTNP